MAARKSKAPEATAVKADKGKRTDRDTRTLGKIEKLAAHVLGQAGKGSNPALEIRTRTLTNVSFNEKRRSSSSAIARSRASSSTRPWSASSCRRCSSRANARR